MDYNKFKEELEKKMKSHPPRLSEKQKQEGIDSIINESISKHFYYPMIAMEEMAELTQVMSKIRRIDVDGMSTSDKDMNICLYEELADVLNVIDTIIVYFNLDPKQLEYARDVKWERWLNKAGIEPQYRKEDDHGTTKETKQKDN